MDKNKQQEIQINVNLDTTPIVYTDHVIMTANEDGVVLDIGQKLGSTNQVRIVNRIGMSRSHAKKFLKELGNLVAITEGKGDTGEKKKN